MEWKKGERYLQFKIVEVTEIEELKSKLIELEHEGCGSKVLYLGCDDPENLFCLSFRTIPNNSKGVAHILEHVVLCGSRKYPVKDPFFAMTRRSLHTYMNALTGADFTCYPASSMVEKDFYNLLDVYLDAAFYPELKEESFLQEGVRIELVTPQQLDSDLIWKGVVFNEMKGALASPDSRLWHAISSHLMPDLTYAYISGGDPKEIPSLTYDELKAFHQMHYHPSRCLFFFYGNLPLEKHLDFIENRVLKESSKIPPLPPLALQTRFKQPKTVESVYPHPHQSEDEIIVAWSWLTVQATEQDTLLALSLLDAILMETDASLLKLPLLQSGLCSTADGILETDVSEVPYALICKGCKRHEIEALEEILFKTLNQIVSQGIPSHIVEACLHQLELSRTEIGGDHTPFGLSLFFRAALAEQHGGRAEKGLKIHTLFDDLRKKLEHSHFLTDLLSTYLINNHHRVRVVLKPDPSLLNQEQAEENSKLAQLKEQLSAEDRQRIAFKMEHLKQFQEEQALQNIECLPKVTLKDVPKETRHFPLHQKGAVLTHSTFTNGFVYLDLIMDLPALSEEQLPWAQLLVSLLPEVGVGLRSYIQNLEILQAYVGGQSTSLLLYPQVHQPHGLRPALVLRTKALERHCHQMVELLQEWVLKVRLDEKERIEELLQQIHTAFSQRLVKNGMKYAMSEAFSTLSPSSYISEQWSGFSYVKWIQQLVQSLPNNLPLIIEKLQEMKHKLLSCHNLQIVVTGSDKGLALVDTKALLQLPPQTIEYWKNPTLIPPMESHARVFPSPVAFTCAAMKTISYLDPAAPALSVASHLMDQLVLHPRIREQGGAYGAGSTYAPILGHFSFHTYRDPHLQASLDAFKEALECVAGNKFSVSDLESAKLEAIQSMDAPVSPGTRAAVTYSYKRQGLSLEQRQLFRERLLTLSIEDVAQSVKDHLEKSFEKSIIVSWAPAQLIEKENQNRQKPLPIIPI